MTDAIDTTAIFDASKRGLDASNEQYKAVHDLMPFVTPEFRNGLREQDPELTALLHEIAPAVPNDQTATLIGMQKIVDLAKDRAQKAADAEPVVSEEPPEPVKTDDPPPAV